MVGSVWVWAGISFPFTVPWAKAQGRCQVHLFLLSQIPRSLVIPLEVYPLWVHQAPEAHLSALSLTHIVGCGGESRSGTCQRWWEGGRFHKSLRFIVFYTETTIHTFPPGSPTDLPSQPYQPDNYPDEKSNSSNTFLPLIPTPIWSLSPVTPFPKYLQTCLPKTPAQGTHSWAKIGKPLPALLVPIAPHNHFLLIPPLLPQRTLSLMNEPHPCLQTLHGSPLPKG